LDQIDQLTIVTSCLEKHQACFVEALLHFVLAVWKASQPAPCSSHTEARKNANAKSLVRSCVNQTLHVHDLHETGGRNHVPSHQQIDQRVRHYFRQGSAKPATATPTKTLRTKIFDCQGCKEGKANIRNGS
jgi:hypothetical protein